MSQKKPSSSKAATSRRQGATSSKDMTALFPPMHVSSATETHSGPRAPPRNKMALYEHVTIPSRKATSTSGNQTVGSNPVADPSLANQNLGFMVQRYEQRFGYPSYFSRQMGGQQGSGVFLEPSSVESGLSSVQDNLQLASRHGLQDPRSVPPQTDQWHQRAFRSTSQPMALQPSLQAPQCENVAVQAMQSRYLPWQGRSEQENLFASHSLSQVGSYKSARPESSNGEGREGRDPQNGSGKFWGNRRESQHVSSVAADGRSRDKERIHGFREPPADKDRVAENVCREEVREEDAGNGAGDQASGGSSCGADEEANNTSPGSTWLVPKTLIDKLGHKQFWDARKTIVSQEKTFSSQVSELHRIVKQQSEVSSLIQATSHSRPSRVPIPATAGALPQSWPYSTTSDQTGSSIAHGGSVMMMPPGNPMYGNQWPPAYGMMYPMDRDGAMAYPYPLPHPAYQMPYGPYPAMATHAQPMEAQYSQGYLPFPIYSQMQSYPSSMAAEANRWHAPSMVPSQNADGHGGQWYSRNSMRAGPQGGPQLSHGWFQELDRGAVGRRSRQHETERDGDDSGQSNSSMGEYADDSRRRHASRRAREDLGAKKKKVRPVSEPAAVRQMTQRENAEEEVREFRKERKRSRYDGRQFADRSNAKMGEYEQQMMEGDDSPGGEEQDQQCKEGNVIKVIPRVGVTLSTCTTDILLRSQQLRDGGA